jgi:hypothetical protein
MRAHAMKISTTLVWAALAMQGGCEDVGCTEGEAGCLDGPCRAGGCDFDLICTVDNRCMHPTSLACNGATSDEVCTAWCLAWCARNQLYCGGGCSDGFCSSPQYLRQCRQDEFTRSDERSACTFAKAASCEEWLCGEESLPADCD